MKREGLAIPGFPLDKTGKLMRSRAAKSVSQRVRERKSKRARVVARRRFGS
jgi:hypothetical protein